MKVALSSALIFSLSLISYRSMASDISLNVTNAPLREVLRTATKGMNKSYQAAADLCERFSIVTPTDMTSMEAQVTLESALMSHGYTIIPRDRVYIVRSVRSVDSDGPGKSECQVTMNNIVTRVFRLKNLPAVTAIKLVQPHMSKESFVDQVPSQDTIIVSDDANFVERARSILKSHDPIADL